MGNYSNMAVRPKLNFNPTIHQFQSNNVQRLKQTPFISAEPYSINPPIFMDTIDIRMRQLLQPRVVTHQLFPPPEVLKIIENVVNGLLQLQQHDIKAHGDLSTQTIYYDKRTKKFKITHPICCAQSGYQLTRNAKRFSLLSPEQLLTLTDPNSQVQNLVSIKSDLFVLGIIMLEVCTLLPSSEIYCPDTYVIFDKEIQNRMEIIGEYYAEDPILGGRIIKLLNYLLQYDQIKRKSCKEILWQFQEFQRAKNPSIPPNMFPRKIEKPFINSPLRL